MWDNLIEITNLFYKEVFLGKMIVTFCLPFLSYHATYHFRKIFRVDFCTEDCKNLVKFGSNLLICPKRDFCFKLITISYVYLLTPSSYKISSKSLELIIRCKVA